MSDTDDGFDEEAVRRELREKYENDDRAETERMSELLLQGATMTNQHCETCGSPIFRYDGQAFCPNCQQGGQQAAGQQGGEQQAGGQRAPADGQAAEGSQGGAEGAAGAESAASGAADAANTADATNAADASGEVAPPAGADVDQHAADAGRRQPPSQTGDSTDASRPQSPAGGQPRHVGQSGSSAAASSEAADALESSIAALARRAAGSDDPRTAREYLEAAREAAEALAALRHNA